MLSPPFFAVLILGAVLVLMFLGWYLSKDARTRRALRQVGRTSIAEAREGQLVKVTGTLKIVGEPLLAPLSGRPCAAWEVRVEEQRSSGKSSHWHTIVHEQESVGFLLEDSTGRAFVAAGLPQMALEQDARYRSGTFEDATAHLEAFLSSRGHSSIGLLGFNKQIRYLEGALEEGETVTALGVARWEPDPDPSVAGGGGYRSAAMRLAIDEPKDGSVLLSDDAASGG